MYKTLLILHNIIRWVVLILGISASFRVLFGLFLNRIWTDFERRISLFFTISLDIQLVVGTILYFVYSSWGLNAILSQGMANVMGSSEYRFYAIEHVSMMLLALIFAHLGNALPKKVDESKAKFRRAALWIGLATILILLAIPWDRPLFPGL